MKIAARQRFDVFRFRVGRGVAADKVLEVAADRDQPETFGVAIGTLISKSLPLRLGIISVELG